EFAFVILGLAATNGAVAEPVAQAITLAVALSMIATPFLLVLYDRLIATRFADAAARPADTPRPAKVIVAGLGRVGQVVARLLNASGYQPTVLDDDPDHVEQCRKFGFRVFYGDATRLDLLHAAGADSADFLDLKVIARAHDMRHMFELRDIGIEATERETWLGALKLGEVALAQIS